MATFIYHKSAEDYLLRSPNGPTTNHMRELAERIESLAEKQVGVDTGELRSSIHIEGRFQSSGMAAFLIGSSNSIAYLHHEGSRPHVIRPKTAKTLRIAGYGTIVYARQVYHPGTRPNRYLTGPLSVVI